MQAENKRIGNIISKTASTEPNHILVSLSLDGGEYVQDCKYEPVAECIGKWAVMMV